MPIKKPLPLISLITFGYLSLISLRFDKKYFELLFILFKNFLSEMISITEFPTAIAKGLPPKVEP